MKHFNERRAVERVIGPKLLITVVEEGARRTDTEENAKAVAFLQDAMRVEIEGCPVEGRAKFARRVERLGYAITAPYRKTETPVAKFGLIVFYFMRNLVDQGYYALDEAGPFSAGLDMILPALEEWANIDGVDRSAQKQARKVHAAMQQEGYFVGVPFGQMAEAA